MKLLTALTPFLFLFSYGALATPQIESMEQLQERCGDDLRCYFTPEELQEAAGPLYLQSSPYESFFENEDGDVAQILQPESRHAQKSSTQGAPIWASFIQHFRECAPGCVPANYSTYGKRAKPSCHNTGKAADVGSIVCKGTEHKAIHEGKYKTFVGCMKKKMTVLYENGAGVTLGHHDHAHFSNGCVLPGGHKYW